MHGVAADGVVLQFARHQRQRLDLGRDGRKETAGRGKLQTQAGEGLAVVAYPGDKLFAGTATMIADPGKAQRVGNALWQGGAGRPQMRFRQPRRIVGARDAEGCHLRTVREAAPAEQPRRQGQLMLLRTHHDVVLLAGFGHKLGQRRRVSEGIGVEGHLGKDAEALEEVLFAAGDLAAEADGAGRITIGLHPPAAGESPASRLHVPPEAPEQRPIVLLDLLVDPRLALGVDGVRVVVKPVAGAAAGGQRLVDPGLPGPEPDGVQVRMQDDVDRSHGEILSSGLGSDRSDRSDGSDGSDRSDGSDGSATPHASLEVALRALAKGVRRPCWAYSACQRGA